MDLKKAGEINNIKDIPFDRHVIVSGTMSNGDHGWIWRMPGIFIKNDNGIFFRNHNDLITKIDENTILGLKLLER